MIDNKFGYGIVGCGTISKWHAEAAAKTEQYELIAVTDVVKEAAVSFADKYKAVAEDSFDALLKRDDIEVVSLCTPSGLHAEYAVKAANAGKHIIIEKPMAITKDQIEQIMNAMQKNNVQMQVISQMRFNKNIQMVKDAVDAGKLGKIVVADVSMKYFRSQEYYDSGGWRGTWALDGGGALMNQGIHGIDALYYMAGPVKSVFAHAKTLARKIEVEDTAVAAVEFESGALGTITGTTSVYPGISRRFEINGTKGSITIVEGQITMWDIEGEQTPEGIIAKDSGTTSASDPTNFGIEGHVLQFEDLADALLSSRAPKVNHLEGKVPVEIILAVYESERSKKVVYL